MDLSLNDLIRTDAAAHARRELATMDHLATVADRHQVHELVVLRDLMRGLQSYRRGRLALWLIRSVARTINRPFQD